MTPTPIPSPSLQADPLLAADPPLPADPRLPRFQLALQRLAERGVELARRLIQSCTAAPAGPASPAGAAFTPPDRTPSNNPVLAFLRLHRAVHWSIALSRVLAGLYCPPTQCAKRANAIRSPGASDEECLATPETLAALATQAEAPNRSETADLRETIIDDRAKDRNAERWMHTVFATRPIGAIVLRLCRDLGIAENTELWPAEFLTITQTPAEWAAGHQKPSSPPASKPPARRHHRIAPRPAPIRSPEIPCRAARHHPP